MVDPRKFYLEVTTGTSYDSDTHDRVLVNTSTPVKLQSDKLDAQVSVRIQNYRGLPEGSPESSPYFDKAPHTYDLYSIAFSFTPKSDIPGDELLFGNDFDQSISKNLPPGFSTALRMVKWSIDPGLDGDVYADKPYLYGPLASSINVLWVGDKDQESQSTPDDSKPWEEGGSESGKELRDEHKIPEAGPARMKHFLTESHRKDWVFEKGREYRCDFFNPYLDFNDLALKLPGNFKLHLMSFWDGQPLRYTLKRKSKDGSTDDVLLVVLITLMPEEEYQKRAKKGEANTSKKDGNAEEASKPDEDVEFDDGGVD